MSLPAGNDHPASRLWRSAPTSPPGGVFRRKMKSATRQGRQASLGIHGPDREVSQVTTVDRPSAVVDELDRTTWAPSSRPRPNGTRRLTLEHDRVGAGSMADRGYVPEQPVTQCEGTCARDCNYLISAVVTTPGSTAKERCYRYVAQIEYKPQRCQRQ